VLVDAPEEEIATLADDALVLVMTHNHALDLEIVARAIKRDFAYLGLIGSERKWARFQKRHPHLAQRVGNIGFGNLSQPAQIAKRVLKFAAR
jgi:xanthine/CO dehydrogenase XdhC/CoxF family maturation factor